ncbi:excalibur calcium-binding domain-containing protein [Rheinheimera salexigens]|uniref:Excalibur calcium-binding domain-containing protein n=1 Tax=Rheinheimera salexigens TaxID=1628148 RepID=A0A1E7Q284_9GAMM|nr:excalibur calcium-binding domain-containing protein [Rheinheimera salexigens]OEY68305.1 hypothetical protein BI198_01040 [Rheinheimera salexigens]
MKKILLIALIGYGGWQFYQKQSVAQPVTEPTVQVLPDYTVPLQKAREAASLLQFRCDGRQHCSQMKSYDEAVFFLRNCPDTKMDGDNDGIPCERQFNKG